MNTIPFWHKIRWTFSLSRRRIYIKCGVFLLEACYRHVQPLVNNVSVDEQVTGLWFAWFPINATPGQSFPIRGWRKTININAWESECQE